MSIQDFLRVYGNNKHSKLIQTYQLNPIYCNPSIKPSQTDNIPEKVEDIVKLIRLKMINGSKLSFHQMYALLEHMDQSNINLSLDELLNVGCNFNCFDQCNVTLLSLASFNGKENIVAWLLSPNIIGKINPNARDMYGGNALFSAVRGGNKKIVAQLIDVYKKSNYDMINAQDVLGNTALILATYDNDQEIVSQLIDENVDLNIQNKIGDTALIVASRKNYPEIATHLIAACKRSNSSLDIKNINGETAFKCAMFNSQNIRTQLIANKCDVTIRDEYGGECCLGMAVLHRDHNLVKQLISIYKERKYNMNIQNKDGNTPLLFSVANGDLEISKNLVTACIEEKHDLNIQNNNGITPLMAAVRGRYRNIATLLINSCISTNSSLNVQDKSGNTALMHAINHRQREIVSELIDACILTKSDLGIKNNNDKSALDYARELGYQEIVDLFVSQ